METNEPTILNLPSEAPSPLDNRHTPVTIPYFLYEAMARAYYSQQMPVHDIPIPPTPTQDHPSMEDLILGQWGDDVPASWRPRGAALRARHSATKENHVPVDPAPEGS